MPRGRVKSYSTDKFDFDPFNSSQNTRKSQSSDKDAIDFFKRIRTLEAEIDILRDDIKEVFREAEESGCVVSALKEMLRRANKNPDDLAIQDSYVAQYEEAYGVYGIHDYDRAEDD